ncbi:MAG: TrkH family potassium uptake protein, partial [Actinomycetia bacterium]|nr:TrkH family potassium uptake protein [Actinomycetes bacterium]
MPFLIALFNREWNPALDFVISGCVAFIFGEIILFLSIEGEAHVQYAFTIVPSLWIIVMFLGAIPLYLSGHFGSYLDACFDSMSGFATTGLSLIQDLDHLSYGVNFWRHFIMFIGGQGVIVAGILFLAAGSTGVIYQLYAGEGREEKIYPNVLQTAKFIWLVSFVYMILG